MTEEQKQARESEILAKEIAENRPRILWLSFCDPDKPEGSQFLGVVITEALGFLHAIHKTWALGINPGGEVLSTEIETNHDLSRIQDRLLSKADLIEAKLVEEED